MMADSSRRVAAHYRRRWQTDVTNDLLTHGNPDNYDVGFIFGGTARRKTVV
jgi:hypothetical protein